MNTFFALLGILVSFSSFAASEKVTVAVIPKGSTHEFWKSIHAGALQAAQELGGVDVIWKGPLKEDDRNSQIEVMEAMVTRGVSGIVLAPLDDVALRASVENAVKSKVPVVIIDSGLKTDKYTSFVATDNYKGGVMAAEQLSKVLGGKGKIAMLRYAEGSASTMQREQGFMDKIKEYRGIEVVSSNQYGGATTETAYKASENLLASVKNLDGIYTPNESTTFGMLRALQDAKRIGKMKFIGFDSSTKLIEGLKKGEIHGLIVQNPMAMGYVGVKTLVAALKGEKVSNRIDTGATLVTIEKMNDPKIRNLVEPDLKKWLK